MFLHAQHGHLADRVAGTGPGIADRALGHGPDIDNSCLKLKVEGVGADNCTVEAIARDGQTAVAKASGKAGEEIKLEVPRDKLKLWSPDTPFLTI